MKKVYINPTFRVIDLEDSLCQLMTGSDNSSNPSIGKGGGTDEGGVTGGDVKAQSLWDKEW